MAARRRMPADTCNGRTLFKGQYTIMMASARFGERVPSGDLSTISFILVLVEAVACDSSFWILRSSGSVDGSEINWPGSHVKSGSVAARHVRSNRNLSCHQPCAF